MKNKTTNEYDKIVKENIEAVIVPLAGKILNIQIESLVEIPDDLQVTLERRPDFLKKVKDATKHEFILQIEFQASNETNMVYRMLEYKAILLRKYKLPVRQFVIYLGSRKLKMKTKLADDLLIFSFKLINVKDYSYKTLVASDIPEEIILAVLGNYWEDSPEKVIQTILKRIIQITPNELLLQKYIRQLGVLSKLRNLQVETFKQIEGMGIRYNIETDVVYQKGIEEGKKEMIIELLKDASLSIEKIASMAKVSGAYVKQIQKEITK